MENLDVVRPVKALLKSDGAILSIYWSDIHSFTRLGGFVAMPYSLLHVSV